MVKCCLEHIERFDCLEGALKSIRRMANVDCLRNNRVAVDYIHGTEQILTDGIVDLMAQFRNLLAKGQFQGLGNQMRMRHQVVVRIIGSYQFFDGTGQAHKRPQHLLKGSHFLQEHSMFLIHGGLLDAGLKAGGIGVHDFVAPF